MKKRGRPKGDSKINREVILSNAFDMINEAGPHSLSMRGLASRLNVTPMAIYNHFPDRAILVREMSDVVYAKVAKNFEDFSGSVQSKIQNLLFRYYQACVQYPNLTMLIFATPKAFSQEVKQINNDLKNLLHETKLSLAKKQMWLEILVDFTHGSAMAMATSRDSKSKRSQDFKYRLQLKELLGCIFD
jgi:AcrR family transcriptional regulator